MHTRQKLIDNTIGCTASITNRPTTRLGNGIQLVKENYTGSSRASLVEDVANIALRLAEPHAQQLGAFDGDEIGGALVGDGLGKHGLTGTGWTVEEYTTRGRQTKFEEFFGMVDGILHALDKFTLDLL